MKLRTIAIFAAGMLFQAMVSRKLFPSARPVPICQPSPPARTEARAVSPKPVPLLAGGLPLPRAKTERREERRSPELSASPELTPVQETEVVDERACPGTASEYHLSHPSEERLSCLCSSGAVDSGTVWGSGTYTADSSICRAARHAGIWSGDGDEVTLYFKSGQARYEGSESYGIRSESYGSWESSFSFSP